MTELDRAWIAEVTKADAVTGAERVQSLWSGYGEILRVHLRGAAVETAIVKWVRPPQVRNDVSHARKCRSYDVETTWYRGLASRCSSACRVPTLFGSRGAQQEWLLVLEDLDAVGYSKRRHHLDTSDTALCLRWLAALHAQFLGTKPAGLWKTGTYWHLATRRDELAAMDDDALREAAPELDRRLRSAAFQTIVHGDAKPANFCFGARGQGVAAVDFQYVGGGCGMKDVAYLISDEPNAAHYLNLYFESLRERLIGTEIGTEIDIPALESEWRALYPIACADYYRFIAGWAGSHWQRDRRAQSFVRDVLRTL